MDGIDVALIETDGEVSVSSSSFGTGRYPLWLREELQKLIVDPIRSENGDLSSITDAVTDAHCVAVEQFLTDHKIAHHSIDVIGFHGQTILHAPERGITRQLFNGKRAAERLHIDAVCQFRLADVAAGGQGAPLIPLFHEALAKTRGLSRPVVFLNLGGVANISYIDHESLLAFDTGPASAMLDDFIRLRRNESFDRDGSLAQAGSVHRDLVRHFLSSDYFNCRPPKSLDRNAFHGWMSAITPLSDEDGAATLAAFTVESIAAALHHLPQQPRQWLVGGGGRHNRFIMQELGNRLGVPVLPVEAVGPLSLPTTTGVPVPLTGGEIFKAHKNGR
jgi:anhydro-N-acetylmuramic acid kinase